MIKIWMKESWGKLGMMIFPFILINKKLKSTPEKLERVINHEKIHILQCLEMLVIPFHVWYGIEYIIGRIKGMKHNDAYRNISFEKEAFDNDDNLKYRKDRKLYAFTKYL